MNKYSDSLVQGETARLFPVLSNNSSEGRTTSIVLACVSLIEEFGAALLEQVGQMVGKRSQIDAFTEVVLKNRPENSKDRPDGLLILSTGRNYYNKQRLHSSLGYRPPAPQTILPASHMLPYYGEAA